jgi:predicted metal-binding protein
LQEVTPKWKRGGVVLVCERCFKERIPEETPDVAAEIGDFNLRNWLKTRLKEDGRWGEIRALSTSCMDVCARGRVTVSIQFNGREPLTTVVHPVVDRDELYETIVKTLPNGG